MATIKDVAKAAGVSVTTVSIIINGKAAERKISPETQERVVETMRKIGYQPNLTARRLRSQAKSRPAVAFFWPLDYRTAILASFLNSIESELKRIGYDLELVVQTYENDHLDQYNSALLEYGYNAVIVGACSIKDVEYLESLSPQVPFVLINRTSERYSTICTDQNDIGFMAARQIRQCGYTEAAVFTTSHSYVASGLRTQAFLHACSRLGIKVLPEHIFHGNSTIDGGYQLGEHFTALKNTPSVIFCDSDAIAIGALYAFNRHHIRVPDDIEILTIAMLEPDNTQYTIPSLSVIEMPNREVCKELVHLLQEKIMTNSLEPTHIKLDARLILRESFRGVPQTQ